MEEFVPVRMNKNNLELKDKKDCDYFKKNRKYNIIQKNI